MIGIVLVSRVFFKIYLYIYIYNIQCTLLNKHTVLEHKNSFVVRRTGKKSPGPFIPVVVCYMCQCHYYLDKCNTFKKIQILSLFQNDSQNYLYCSCRLFYENIQTF